MRWIGGSRQIGRALAAGALLGLVGCQQLLHQSARRSSGWDNQPKADGTITPAQEADFQISMGRIAERQGNFEQAMAAYRAATGRDKRRADAYARMAVLYDKQGKFRESAELYRKALAQRPGDPEIFCDMGYSFYLQRRWAEAEMNLRQAIAVDPDLQRAHNNLALLLVRDNRLEDALAEFTKGGSKPAQAHLNLAFALSMDRRWEPARAEYQRALALDPSSQLAKDRLDQLNALVAKLEKPRDGAPQDPRVLTTSTDSPPPRRPDVPAAAPTATAKPPEAARPQALTDSRLVATAATLDPPRRPARARVAAPSLPAEDKAMRDLWAALDSAAGAPPRRQPGPPTGAPTAPPQRRTSRPQPHATRPEGSSSSPSLAVVDAPRPAPAVSRGPKRPIIPPPVKPTKSGSDTGSSRTPPIYDLPPLQTIP